MDVIYKFFKNGYLLTTSMFCEKVCRWIPIHFSWIRGLEETYYHEHFWIQKGGMFILIRYYAVHDEHGTYLVVVETTEEISELRSLEGSKTLMSD